MTKTTISRGFVGAVLALATFAAVGCSDDDEGEALLTWSLQAESTGAPVTCTDEEIVRVQMGTLVEDFDCSAGEATIGGLEPGVYRATLQLIDDSGIESELTISVTIEEDLITDMGHFVFIVPE